MNNYPIVFNNLSYALRIKSQSPVKSFLIAHECNEIYVDENGEQKERKREYILFESIEQYLSLKQEYSHGHEIIHGIVFNDYEETPPGRLAFDFDVDEKLYYNKKTKKYSYVHDTFKQDIENIILYIFNNFYENIDVSKLQFVWLTSKNESKFSKHLIVKNAFFF